MDHASITYIIHAHSVTQGQGQEQELVIDRSTYSPASARCYLHWCPQPKQIDDGRSLKPGSTCMLLARSRDPWVTDQSVGRFMDRKTCSKQCKLRRSMHPSALEYDWLVWHGMVRCKLKFFILLYITSGDVCATGTFLIFLPSSNDVNYFPFKNNTRLFFFHKQ